MTKNHGVSDSSPGLAAPKIAVTSLVNLHNDQAACDGSFYTNFYTNLDEQLETCSNAEQENLA